MSAAVASYDAARRAWRRAPGTPAKWPRAGSLRGGRVAEAPPAGRDASALRVTHYRWPTLTQHDGIVGCGKFRSGSFVIFGTTHRGWLVPRWCEWHMGFAPGWTIG